MKISANSSSTLPSEEMEAVALLKDSENWSSVIGDIFNVGDSPCDSVRDFELEVLLEDVKLFGMDLLLKLEPDPVILKTPPSLLWLTTLA